MKTFALLLLSLGLLLADVHEGNFNIRFQPTADLQTGVEVPFEISVTDALHKPLPDAKVTMMIETIDHQDVKVFHAPALDPGMYVAKPTFPHPGQWNLHVEVTRNNEMSARDIVFNVPR